VNFAATFPPLPAAVARWWFGVSHGSHPGGVSRGSGSGEGSAEFGDLFGGFMGFHGDFM